MLKTSVLCLLTVVLCACQTSDDYLYKPYSSFAEYGFKDRLKEDGTYWLSFLGTRRTTEEQVLKFWQQHAKTLCKGDYQIIEQQAETQIWKENQFNSGSFNADSRTVEIKKPYMKGVIACS